MSWARIFSSAAVKGSDMARKFISSWSTSVMLGMVVAKRWSRRTHFNAATGPPGFCVRSMRSARKPGRFENPPARLAGAITFMATMPMPASTSFL